MSTLLAIQNLQTYFFTPAGLIKAINGVDLHIGVGEPWPWSANRVRQIAHRPFLLRLVPTRTHRRRRNPFRRPGPAAHAAEEMRRVRGNRSAWSSRNR